MKKINELVANVNEVEIFEMPELMLIGKEIRCGGKLEFLGNRASELWDMCIEDGSLEIIKKLPSLIPNALIGWNGNYTSEDETFSYIIGAFVPLGTPVPRGYSCRVLPATLVAKGIYDTGYAMIDTYKSWGYTQNYDLFGWNGELYFKDDSSPIKWSQLTPVKKEQGYFMKLDGLGIFVKDMATMVRFYRDVLGFGIKEDENTSNVYLEKDGTLFLLYGRSDFEKMTNRSFEYADTINGHYEIALSVENYAAVDLVFNEVISKGAIPVLEPTTEPWGQRTCYIADPEGNLIEIGSFNK